MKMRALFTPGAEKKKEILQGKLDTLEWLVFILRYCYNMYHSIIALSLFFYWWFTSESYLLINEPVVYIRTIYIIFLVSIALPERWWALFYFEKLFDSAGTLIPVLLSFSLSWLSNVTIAILSIVSRYVNIANEVPLAPVWAFWLHWSLLLFHIVLGLGLLFSLYQTMNVSKQVREITGVAVAK